MSLFEDQTCAASFTKSFLLQDELEQHFTTLESLRKFSDVIRFACCLSDQPLRILQRIIRSTIMEKYNKCLDMLVPIVTELRKRGSKFVNREERANQIESRKICFMPSQSKNRVFTTITVPMTEDYHTLLLGDVTEGTKIAIVSDTMWGTVAVLKALRKQKVVISCLNTDGKIKATELPTCNTTENQQAQVLCLQVDVYVSFDEWVLVSAFEILHELQKRQPVHIDNMEIEFVKLPESVGVQAGPNVFQFPSPIWSHIALQLRNKELRALDLSTSARITADLGTAIGTSSSLRQVDLHSCSMTPEVSKSVSTGLSHCPNIERLDLRINTLTGCRELGAAIATKSSLKHLDLFWCRMTPEVSKSVSRGLLHCPNIERLNLSGNTLTGCTELDSSIASMSSLTHLDLSMCDMTPEVSKSVSTGMSHCPNIERLNLSGYTLTTELGAAIATMSSLTELDLSGCGMTPEVSKSVLTGLSHCPNLMWLYLRGNTLTGCLPNLFQECSPDHPDAATSSENQERGFPNLWKLDLDDVLLNSTDVQALQDALREGKLPELEQLQAIEQPDGLFKVDWE